MTNWRDCGSPSFGHSASALGHPSLTIRPCPSPPRGSLREHDSATNGRPDDLDITGPASSISSASRRRPAAPTPARGSTFLAACPLEDRLRAVGARFLVAEQPLGFGFEYLGVAVFAERVAQAGDAVREDQARRVLEERQGLVIEAHSERGLRLVV